MNIIKKCKQCGKEMIVPEWKIKDGRGVFCSRSCLGKYGNAARNKITPCVSPKADKASKIRANGLINMRVKRGLITKPVRCEECNKIKKLDAHHEDYNKPDKIEWLCRSCHMKRHWKKAI